MKTKCLRNPSTANLVTNFIAFAFISLFTSHKGSANSLAFNKGDFFWHLENYKAFKKKEYLEIKSLDQFPEAALLYDLAVQGKKLNVDDFDFERLYIHTCYDLSENNPQFSEIVGYTFFLKDPDGAIYEFSHTQRILSQFEEDQNSFSGEIDYAFLEWNIDTALSALEKVHLYTFGLPLKIDRALTFSPSSAVTYRYISSETSSIARFFLKNKSTSDIFTFQSVRHQNKLGEIEQELSFCILNKIVNH